MADEETIFDPTLKKKKKVKKPLDLSVLEGGEDQPNEQQNRESEQKEQNDDDVDLSDFTGLKKKKKKKKPFNLDDLENALPDDQQQQDAVKETENGKIITPTEDAKEGEAEAELGDDLDFTSKKKKRKKKINFEDMVNTEITDEVDCIPSYEDAEKENEFDISPTGNQGGIQGDKSWLGTDRDYTYDELLQLVFSIIKEKNPDIEAGTKKRLVMRPPQVLRVGTKKTSFANFLEICKSLHRQPKHMQAFLLAELGTSGSVDANNQLIIKGRFQQKQLESVLRRYIKEYVACQTCRSPDTILQKETRLFFLQCETCGSRRSVASIKSGFQAVTGKRAAIRAKIN